MRKSPLLILFLLWSTTVRAEEGAAFLKILSGARPVAMGEAYTAVADDLSALGTNAAGLSRIGAREDSFMHAELFGGTHHDFLGYAHPLSQTAPVLGGGTLGFGLQRISNDTIPGRDANGAPTSSFGASDTALDFGYSRPLFDSRTSLGITAKVIRSQLAEATDNTAAFGLGAMHTVELGKQAVTFGAAIANLGPGLKLGDKDSSLPLTLAFGASTKISGALLVAADFKHRPYSHETVFGFGTEYALLSSFSLRAGYAAANTASNTLNGALSGLGVGFGLKIYKAKLDYSFTPAGDLGEAQRVGLSTRF
ncbi:MAG: PorV/PorQ family protein [Elusimicrobia bacterium]|nr:PorV/PorQ family protein [Elusimicrobiota bacterium]